MNVSHQSQPRAAVHPAGLLILIATLCVPVQGLAMDYPPPPGPYPSGPLPAAFGAERAVEGVQPEVAAHPKPSNRPALLLPDAPDSSGSGIYGASNLFGSAPAVTEPIPAPTAVFAPPEPTAPTPPGDIDVAPAASAPPPAMPEGTNGQQASAEPAQTYRTNPPAMAVRGYPPPAYPAGRGMPPYAAPAMPQEPWQGGPQFDTHVPAMTAQPAPAGGPVFRPPGSTSN